VQPVVGAGLLAHLADDELVGDEADGRQDAVDGHGDGHHGVGGRVEVREALPLLELGGAEAPPEHVVLGPVRLHRAQRLRQHLVQPVRQVDLGRALQPPQTTPGQKTGQHGATEVYLLVSALLVRVQPLLPSAHVHDSTALNESKWALKKQCMPKRRVHSLHCDPTKAGTASLLSKRGHNESAASQSLRGTRLQSSKVTTSFHRRPLCS
jgi:hypothetical protein